MEAFSAAIRSTSFTAWDQNDGHGIELPSAIEFHAQTSQDRRTALTAVVYRSDRTAARTDETVAPQMRGLPCGESLPSR